MAIDNEELTAGERAPERGQVASAEAVDAVAKRVTLNATNLWFILENFGTRVFGSFLVMPEHNRSATKDPAKFTVYPPMGTGPFQRDCIATNFAIWTRRNRPRWGQSRPFRAVPPT